MVGSDHSPLVFPASTRFFRGRWISSVSFADYDLVPKTPAAKT
jgi:hypothetical protein